MTTIYLSTKTARNANRFQVFGAYEGNDDRYTFAVQSFERLTDAERYAATLCEIHNPDAIVRD